MHFNRQSLSHSTKKYYNVVKPENQDGVGILFLTGNVDNWGFSIRDEWGIDSIRTDDVISDLEKLGQIHTLIVNLNTPGGLVLEGIRLYNYLKGLHSKGIKVITQNDGLVGSIGTLIYLAGSVRRSAPNAYFVFHEVSGGAYGGASSLRREADVIDQFNADLQNTIMKETSVTQETINEWWKQDTWINGADAATFGIVTEQTEGLKLTAKLNVKSLQEAGFKNIPKQLLNQNRNNKMKNFIKNFFNGLTENGFKIVKEEGGQAVDATQTLLNSFSEKFKDIKDPSDDIAAIKNELQTLRNDVAGKQTTIDALAKEVADLKGGESGGQNGGPADISDDMKNAISQATKNLLK